MSVNTKVLLPLGALGFAFLSSCAVNVDRKCSSLNDSRELPKECCTAAGGLKPELIAAGSKCSIETIGEPTKTLLTKCGPQGIPGGGLMSGISGTFGQSLNAVGTQSQLALKHVSDKDGVETDNASASEGPTPFTPNNNTAGMTGGTGGPSPSTSSGNRDSSSSAINSGGGLSAGSGSTKTGASKITDPNAQLGYVADPDSTYGSGGGGAGRSKSGGGSAASGLGGLISSFMSGMPGAGGSGKDAANPNGMQRYGSQGGGTSAEGVLRSADPEDYFTRVAPKDSLFEIVGKRYEQTSLKGQIR